MSYDDGRCLCILELLPYGTRFLGVATAVVIWGIGFDMTYHHHVLGNYVIAISVMLLFFETTWAVSLFLDICLRSEHNPIRSCWSVILWFDSWKKSIVYWTLATVLIVKPHKLWLTTIAGGMLVTLGLFHFIEGFRRRYRIKETLLQSQDEPYDRFDEETESMNGEISNDQESESVSNTEYVLQV